MKYFLVEGIVKHPENMTEKMMQEHKDYIFYIKIGYTL